MLTLQQLESQHLLLIDKIRVLQQISSNEEKKDKLEHLTYTLQLVHDAEKTIHDMEDLKKVRENLNLQFKRLKFLQQETEDSNLKNGLLIKKLTASIKVMEAEILKNSAAKENYQDELNNNKETLARLRQESLNWQEQNQDIANSITELAAEVDGLKEKMFTLQTNLTNLTEKIQKVLR